MSENNKLRIHAQITPEQPKREESNEKIRWRSIPHPKQKSQREKLTFGDRLLRNSAWACALLLAVLAIGNIDHPLARQASESVERALTMHIDLDESIGKLSFVQNLMPESALVFLNLSGEGELARPVTGEIIHRFTETQPWLMFSCESGSKVIAVQSGTVTAVTPLSNGSALGVLIDHGDGLESVYAYLHDVSIAAGDIVEKGQLIGSTDDTLYFELRDHETSIDPSSAMGL